MARARASRSVWASTTTAQTSVAARIPSFIRMAVLVSEPEQGVAKQPGLYATCLQHLAVGHLHLAGAARHRADLLDLIDGGQRASTQAHEAARVEPRFERVQ